MSVGLRRVLFGEIYVSCGYLNSVSVRISGPKSGYTPFAQKFQQNASFLKLSSDMPLLWNSICFKSSFSKELEFLENFQVELEFHKFFFFFKVWFAYNSIF